MGCVSHRALEGEEQKETAWLGPNIWQKEDLIVIDGISKQNNTKMELWYHSFAFLQKAFWLACKVSCALWADSSAEKLSFGCQCPWEPQGGVCGDAPGSSPWVLPFGGCPALPGVSALQGSSGVSCREPAIQKKMLFRQPLALEKKRRKIQSLGQNLYHKIRHHPWSGIYHCQECAFFPVRTKDLLEA